jgi:Ca-activated chloride channel family protein
VFVPALLLVHFVSLRKIRRKAMMFANYEAMEKVFGRKILSKNYPLLFARILTLVFLILSLTGIVLVYEGHVSDFDFALAIDASASMLAHDYEPNRLSAAKSAADTFVDSVKAGTMVGVLSFAGTSFVRQELTGGMEKARSAIDGVEVEISGGTAIGQAIVSSTDMLLQSEKDKAVILLTDGENNIGVSIEEALEYAGKFQVTINTIGVGSEEGGEIANTTLSVGLDVQTLQEIANKTGGMYYRARSKRELINAYMEIATGTEKQVSMDISSYLMLIALSIFFVELILVNTKYRTIP